VSAHDAPTLWDLRCAVRESLVSWLREHHREALPRVRNEWTGDVAPASSDGEAPSDVDAAYR
jgi:hypothetical protein